MKARMFAAVLSVVLLLGAGAAVAHAGGPANTLEEAIDQIQNLWVRTGNLQMQIDQKDQRIAYLEGQVGHLNSEVLIQTVAPWVELKDAQVLLKNGHEEGARVLAVTAVREILAWRNTDCPPAEIRQTAGLNESITNENLALLLKGTDYSFSTTTDLETGQAVIEIRENTHAVCH